MKIFKKIILVVTIAAVLATSTGCQLINAIIKLYNPPAYSQRKYIEPDEEAISKLAEEVKTLSQSAGNKQSIVLKRNSFYTAYYQVLTSRLIAELEYYKNINDEAAKERSQYIDNYFNKLQNTAIEMEKTLLTSSYADMIIESAGQDYADRILSQPVKTEQLLTAEAKENELMANYSALYAEAGAEGRKTDEFKNNVATILKDLVVTRNEIASLNKNDDGTAYANYHDYAYAEIYGRDYTPDTANTFRQAVSENLYEIGKKLNSSRADYTTTEGRTAPLSEYQLKQLMPKIIKATASDMLKNWDYMISLGLYDFSVSPNKLNSSFVAEFQQYGDGFMFINATGSLVYDLSTVIHEFGHYNAIFAADPDKAGNGATYSYDLAETDSQCFELLTLPAVKTVLNDNSLGYAYNTYEYNLLTESVWSMLSNCIFDEFEYTIYNAQESELTRDFFESSFDRIWKKYWSVNAETGEKMYDYYDITHIFRSPSYCISYSVSMIFSSEIWALSESPVNTYLNVVSYGQDHYIGEVASAVGLADPFSPETVKQIADAYKSELNQTFGITFDNTSLI